MRLLDPISSLSDHKNLHVLSGNMAVKPLFLSYNGTTLRGLDAAERAFRKALCLEREATSFLLLLSIHPSSGGKFFAIFTSVHPPLCALPVSL